MVTILASGVGLGLYIPSVLIERALARAGVRAEVLVIEGLYTPQHQRAHTAHRDAHHASFALAQLAHRMARGVAHCLDEARVDALLARWRDEARREFVVWAGYWLPLLERHRIASGLALEVDHCRIDAIRSASFRVHPALDARGREIWLWHEAAGRIEHEIPVGDAPPIAFESREHRLVVHGGGWNIGTYRDAMHELARTDYALDVVVHDAAEAPAPRGGDRAWMLEPGWHTWEAASHTPPAFPPMREVTRGVPGQRIDGLACHAMHEVIRHAKAIVSKPGGCTLIDSLAAATPVVMLDAYGDAEQANARLWQRLGYGIDLATWRASGFDPGVLPRLHANLVGRTRAPGYPGRELPRLREAQS